MWTRSTKCSLPGHRRLVRIKSVVNHHNSMCCLQILLKLQKLTDEVSHIKAAVANISAGTVAASLASTANTHSAADSTLETLRANIESAVFCMAFGIGDDAVVPKDDERRLLQQDRAAEMSSKPISSSLIPACDMLLMFINNVSKHPDLPRYKRIPTNNANYKTLLATTAGHKRLLRSVGFDLQGNGWEWTWDPSSKSNEAPSSSPSLLPSSKEMAVSLLSFAMERLKLLKAGQYTPLLSDTQESTAPAVRDVSFTPPRDFTASSSSTSSTIVPSTPSATVHPGSLLSPAPSSSSDVSSSTATTMEPSMSIDFRSLETLHQGVSSASASSQNSLPSASVHSAEPSTASSSTISTSSASAPLAILSPLSSLHPHKAPMDVPSSFPTKADDAAENAVASTSSSFFTSPLPQNSTANSSTSSSSVATTSTADISESAVDLTADSSVSTCSSSILAPSAASRPMGVAYGRSIALRSPATASAAAAIIAGGLLHPVPSSTSASKILSLDEVSAQDIAVESSRT